VREVLDAIELIRTGTAERIAMPGRFRVWREGTSVHCEIMEGFFKAPAPAVPESVDDLTP